jgi:hypothetical protein
VLAAEPVSVQRRSDVRTNERFQQESNSDENPHLARNISRSPGENIHYQDQERSASGVKLFRMDYDVSRPTTVAQPAMQSARTQQAQPAAAESRVPVSVPAAVASVDAKKPTMLRMRTKSPGKVTPTPEPAALPAKLELPAAAAAAGKPKSYLASDSPLAAPGIHTVDVSVCACVFVSVYACLK